MSEPWDLSRKDLDPDALARAAAADPALLQALLDGVLPAVQRAPVRGNSAKALQRLSEIQPLVLLPHWEYLVTLLTSGNGFSQYPAIHIMANLAPYDSEGRMAACLDAFYDLLDGDSVMVAGHVAGVSGQIARAQPALAGRIAERLLQAEIRGLDEQRRDLVRGYILESLAVCAPALSDPGVVLAYAQQQAGSGSPTTRKKAAALLKRLGRGAPGKGRA